MCLILAAVNRDLFHYEFSFRGKRTFTPETDGKGTYLLSEPFTLKPGSYELCFSGEVQENGSSVYLARGDDSVFFDFELAGGSGLQKNAFQVSGSSESLRIGINYDPLSAGISSRKISVVSDHVLYRESLLRHAVISLLVVISALLLIIRAVKAEAFFKLFPVFRTPENERDAVFLFLLAVVLSVPHLLPDSYGVAEDMFFHLSRIEGIAEGIKAGYFPVRDQLYWLKNYGYGAGYFYADPFLYFPVLLRLLGFSLLSCYKIFTFVCTFLSLCTFYITARHISGKRSAGLASAVLFGFCAYRCIAVFYRAAVGEMQSFIFMPLIIYGLYDMFHDRTDRWWIFALGFWGILSSHLISLVLSGCLTAVYLLLRAVTILRERKILAGFFKATAVTVLLGAGFLLPMMEQMNGNFLNINILMSSRMGGLSQNNINPAGNLLLFFHDWKYDANFSRSLYPGWMFLLIPVLRVLLYTKNRKIYPAADTMLLFGIVLMICSTDLFPWKYMIWFLNRIQFTWRLLMPVSVLFPLCGGFYLTELCPGRMKSAMLCLMIGCAVCAFPIYRDTVVNRTVPEDEFIMQDNRVAGMEYLPSGLRAEFIDKNRDTVKSDPEDVQILSHKRRGLSFTFDFSYSGDAEKLTFDVPLIRYHGFQGTFTPENGTRIPLEIGRNKVGLVQVQVDAVPSGSVTVAYRKTLMEKLGEAVTGATLFCIGAVIFFRRKRESGAKKEASAAAVS